MKPVVRKIEFEKTCGTVYITVSFTTKNAYKCSMSVDEIIVQSETPIALHWDTEFDRIRWETIKTEVNWCKVNFDKIRGLYNGE